MPAAPIPAELSQALERLRQRIRRYVAWEGVALVIAVIGAVFWATFLLDAAYFELSHLELPRWFRAALLVAAGALLAAAAATWIGLRLFRQLRLRALALVLERRFPQLGESVITAVEAAEGGLTATTPYQQAMLERTVADAARSVDRLDLSTIFNPRPLRRAIGLAVVLAASVLSLMVIDSAAMERWFDGFVQLHESYWPRRTMLTVRVLVQPGDQIREFEERRYRHPRGGDLTLVVEVPAHKESPDRVRLDYRLSGSGLRRVYLTRMGDQPYQHTFPALLDGVELWVSGGDFAMPRPLRVEVVEPPRLSQMIADTLYPEYTGLNSSSEAGVAERTELPISGTQLTLPIGSDLLLHGRANKPLRAVRVDVDVGLERYELHIGSAAADPTAGAAEARMLAGWLVLRSRDGRQQLRAAWPAEVVSSWMSADRRSFSLPLVLSPNAAEDLLTAITEASGGATLPTPLPWPADALLRIHLEDADRIVSAEPHRLVLTGIVDQPPTLDVALEGIGSAITRQARIPVSGLIRDDYGLTAARFEFQVDQFAEWQPRELANPVPGPVREFMLSRSASEPYERFDVLPLDLSVKQKLALTVVAEDGDTLTGPHRQRSQKFVFTVVSVEELLSILYAKELNLRKRFEQILAELKELQKDLELHRGAADERMALSRAATPDRDALAQLQATLSACAERSLHAIRKNASETAAIAVAFQEIRAELVNNGAETPQNLARLDDRILSPLHRIAERDYPAVDAALGLFRLANEKGSDPGRPIDAVQPELAGLISRMEQILLEMRKLETFHEALELLKSIISDQDGLKDETKTERKARALKALE